MTTVLGASNVGGYPFGTVEGWPSILGYEFYWHSFSRVTNWVNTPGWWPAEIDGVLWIQMGSADSLVTAPLPANYADLLYLMAEMGMDRGAHRVQFVYPPTQWEVVVGLDDETNLERLEQVYDAIDDVCGRESWISCSADLATLPLSCVAGDGLHLSAECQAEAAIIVPEPSVALGLIVSVLVVGALRWLRS